MQSLILIHFLRLWESRQLSCPWPRPFVFSLKIDIQSSRTHVAASSWWPGSLLWALAFFLVWHRRSSSCSVIALPRGPPPRRAPPLGIAQGSSSILVPLFAFVRQYLYSVRPGTGLLESRNVSKCLAPIETARPS